MSKRARITLLGLVFALGVGSSCAERQTTSDEIPPRYRCVWIGVFVDNGGEHRVRVRDQETGLDHTTYCSCSTTEEFLDPEYRAEIGELAYEECVRWVREQGYDPDKSTCLEDLEKGQLAGAYGVAEHDLTSTPEDCGETPSGCGVE